MYKIALLLLFSLPVFAGFFPTVIHTSVTSASGKALTLHTPFPLDGMSGVVIHDYGNGLQAVTAYIEQEHPKKAKIIDRDIIHHEEIPGIKTAVKKGDRVIGGYLYHTVMLLAPDADTYTHITSSYSKSWIHPDLFAIYLSKRGEAFPTRENLAAFAKDYQIGLIAVVRKGTLILLDPISKKIIAEKRLKDLPAKAQFPFYMHFEEIRTGWFSQHGSGDYYQTMEAL
jgi:hypothetical protein